ncbi:sporulation protein [Paenibacillus sp. PK3_47]|uniref:sporulation protein YpjB n=1 Tax=Paenibacillus sp. PK3_47 TaxID=2072642 RepID=UPI00201D2E15|nr:sporulation protein YpjB [Paenibacillus sp. PK3_47]UQZ32384.1 sporulation protein [Paenibacillus sp. PK3_47]
MPRTRSIVLTGLVLCWLLAGMYGDRVSANTAESGGSPHNESNIKAGSTRDSGAPVLNGRTGAQQLEQAAETLYSYVLEGNVVKARAESEEISRIVVSSSFEGLTSVEGINALSALIMDLKAVMAAAEISPEKWEAAAARLRLAANALNHPRQPMWLQYYKLIREDLNDMEQSAAAGKLAGWKEAVARLQSRYENIRPAIVISRKPEVVNAFDSWLSYAAGIPSSSQPVERAKLLEIISYGQDAVRVMFGKERNEPVLSVPLPPQKYGAWGIMAGAFIIGALVYAAYRKYRGENEEWKPV